MKRILLIVLSLFIFSSVVSSAKAHFGGIPAMKINGKFTTPYTLQNIAIGDNYLPSDAAPENYLVNKPIQFEVDPSRLPFPEEVIKQATYSWDFGDGTKGTGLKIAHTYKKIGSHEMVLIIDSGDLSKFGYPPQDPSLNPPQTVMINILPNKSYKVPKAIISIDGKLIKDPTKERFETSFKEKLGPFTLGKTFTFSAADSQTPSSKKIKYLWDFGDNEIGKTTRITSIQAKHAYKENYFIREPALRIVDENGFISDTFVTMENDDPNFNSDEKFFVISPLIIGVVIVNGIAIIGVVIGIVLWGINKNKKQKDE